MAQPRTPNEHQAAILIASTQASNERLAEALRGEFLDGTQNMPMKDYLAYVRTNWENGAWRANEANRIGPAVLYGYALKAFGLDKPKQDEQVQWNQQTVAHLQALAQQARVLQAVQPAPQPGLTAPVMPPGPPPTTGP